MRENYRVSPTPSQENEPIKQDSYLWPAVQAGASLMSVCGGLVGLCLVPENARNPFFWTAIANPAIYAGINLHRVSEIRKANRTFVEQEMERRREAAELKDIVIER